ncbi:hypothetical protein [Eudoraea adriatica]|nr:hypothetical protein [Eudoraea adriatica]
MINFFHYRNRILQMQNQMSSGLPIVIGMVEIAACGRLENIIRNYD